ncbi:MAG: hypothetical protein Kow0040_17320 [Thermogutta sp.]
MKVVPCTPSDVVNAFRAAAVAALGLDAARVFVSAAPNMLQSIPPASEATAAVVPAQWNMESSPQHSAAFPAELTLDLVIYSRTAHDRALSTERLLLDPQRGLLILGAKAVRGLAGIYMADDTSQTQLLRRPLQLVNAGTLGWLEGAGIVIAFLKQTYRAAFEFDV